MKKRIGLIALTVIAVLLIASPVLALSVITDAEYVGEIHVVNVGTLATNVAVPFTLNTGTLITNNYILANCTNTAIMNNGADTPYMPARTGQTDWMIWSPSVPIGTSNIYLYTGGGDMSSKIRYFPGVNGFTTLDSPTLELTNNFKYELNGYFDFSTVTADYSEYIVYKNGTFLVYYHSATSINIEFLGTGLSLTANALTSGEHILIVQADTTDLKVYWDGIQKATMALGGASVINNVSDWQFVWHTGGTLYIAPYLEYQKIWIPYNAALPEQYIKWENGATFTDLSGNGHTVTPTWRTTTSDADVSASLATLAPVSQSQASSYSLAGGVSFVPAVPGAIPNMYDEGETGGLIIDDAINPALAAADIPEAFFWYPVAFAIAIGLGFAAFGWTKQLIVQATVSSIVMACFAGGGVLTA